MAETAGLEVVGVFSQRLRGPQPTSYLGKGKLEEIRADRTELNFDTIIADDELSPAQQRHLETVVDAQVLDRTAVILQIFARHARSREGQLQVELAQYRYLLPRLAGKGTTLSRLGGGINTRGPGETKLETDRRRIRHRIAELERTIDQVRGQRALHRRQRKAAGIPAVALVGYTNSGKSSLLNGLTSAGVLSSDQLFATLDPTTRRLSLPGGLPILITDTVGFIQKLPADLVTAFRATLEEIVEADVIMHVLDVSDPRMDEQAATVEAELRTLGVADKPRVTALNKVDRIEATRLPLLRKRFDNAVAISAATGFGFEALLGRVARALSADLVPVRVQIPYTESELVSLFRERGMVEREVHRVEGTVITGRLPATLLPSFQGFISR